MNATFQIVTIQSNNDLTIELRIGYKLRSIAMRALPRKHPAAPNLERSTRLASPERNTSWRDRSGTYVDRNRLA